MTNMTNPDPHQPPAEVDTAARKTRRLAAIGIALLLLLAMITLPSVLQATSSAGASKEAARDAATAALASTAILEQSNARSDHNACANRYQAHQDEQFRHRFAALITAAIKRDQPTVIRELNLIGRAPNLDDLVDGKILGTPACPPLPEGTTGP